jgi:hypothetical protein
MLVPMIAALLELFRSNFYAIDFAVAGSTLVVVGLLYRTGRIDKFIWVLFWVGVGLGLTWEAPMQILNAIGHPVHSYTRPAPVSPAVIVVMHSLWDGGLFLLGVGLARLVCGGPVLARFRPGELVVLVVWGQASELWVEMTSTLGEAWAYIPRPWNPALFSFNDQDITLMPQLIWLIAPIVFYLIALKIRAGVRA